MNEWLEDDSDSECQQSEGDQTTWMPHVQIMTVMRMKMKF